MSLWIDNHEPQEVIDELTKRHLDVKVQKIDSGDYVFGEVGIERKRLDDFLSSVRPVPGSFRKARLWDQLERLKATYKIPILLVEGRITLDRLVMMDPETKIYLGARASILIGWKMPFLRTESQFETARTIESLYLRYGITKVGNIPPIGVKKSDTPSEIKWYMLQCIAGIGAKTARRILDRYPWFGEIGLVSPKNMAKSIKGLSLKKAELIQRVFGN